MLSWRKTRWRRKIPCRHRSVHGTNVACLLTSRHTLLQEMRLKMDEDLEKCVIEALPVVSSLRFHAAQKKNKSGYRANLRCGCGVQQVGPVRMSSNYPTLRDYLRELGRVIQRDHGPTCIVAAPELQASEKDAADASSKRPADETAASLNANDMLMLHRRLKMIQQRAAEANKVALEAPAPPIVSPCTGIMSCFSFMFLGVPRHYARRS
jgi:hypothetical protein